MKNRLFVVGAVLLVAVCSICCNCKWFETMAQLQVLFDEADVVFVGLPVKNINLGELNSNKRIVGLNVLLKVISVQKGPIHADTVLVLQSNNNCAQRFMRGDTAVVFGYSIKEVRKLKDKNADDYSDDKVFHMNGKSKLYSLCKRLSKVYPTVFTSQCISFSQSDSLVTAFIRAKKR